MAMAVVPMGTANDFATSLGLPEDPWEALQLCVLDTAHPIDVGQVNDKVQSILFFPFLRAFHFGIPPGLSPSPSLCYVST